jgi:hypothetical protein
MFMHGEPTYKRLNKTKKNLDQGQLDAPVNPITVYFSNTSQGICRLS